MSVSSSIPDPVAGTDMVLTALARRMEAGVEFNNTDKVIATAAAASKMATQYGPGFADMELQSPPLPERIQGVIAQYVS